MDPPLLSSCSVDSTYTLWCVIYAHVHVGTNPCASIETLHLIFKRFIYFFKCTMGILRVYHIHVVPRGWKKASDALELNWL